MQIKQIFAALEIADHEVRLMVGEFHETRFNVLRVERANIIGIKENRIIDEANIVMAIRKVVASASSALDYQIERILLAIPSVDVARHNKKINVYLEEGSKRVRLTHIQTGINEAILYKPDDHLELVNIGCIKYIANGITSRKMPLNEVCDVLTMSVDLLFADKDIVYSYARCIEKAGLEIMDICLDSYAMAEEAAIFEQTVDKYVILVDLARQNTTLSLFTHGKLVSCEQMGKGYGEWLEDLKTTYNLPYDVGFRLIRNSSFVEKDLDDSIVYIWSEKGEQKQINEKQLYDSIMPAVKEWVDKLNEVCNPIIESGNVRYLLSGEGMEIRGLESLIKDFNAPAQSYVPQTIGARDCSLVTCLGLFYAWKAQLNVRKDDRICCDIRDINKAIDNLNPRKNGFEESGFTKKLKSMLLSEK
ncbi:MAG: cell division protein FtsA [Erysipelotrichaceae bacterium]